MARMFEARARDDEWFEVVVPRGFALVCFRVRPRGGMTEQEADEAGREFMARVNRTGKAFLASTVVGGRLVLRFAVGSTLQEHWSRGTCN
ncbi:hypothetical protein U9M48_025422 [Paspalum notatum var. saurae]|uniref:Uncharacterized protein n=1 Tax=Paspalum notatum var. saurae TaxID=547442 RepID=A0AAQ3TQC6_PASNO